MRKFLASLPLMLLPLTLAGQNTTHKPAAQRANISDSHEGVTIVVEPWTTAGRYKERFPKKSPLNGGVIALHVSFQNDNERSIKVDLQRIRLLVQISEDERQELQSLLPDDVADVVLLKNNGKDPTARRIPFPIPVGQPRPGHDANWVNFRDTCQNAAVPSSIVAGHGAVEGLLYFDIRGEMELLQTARLYVPNLITMGDNEPVSFFDIALGHGAAN